MTKFVWSIEDIDGHENDEAFLIQRIREETTGEAVAKKTTRETMHDALQEIRVSLDLVEKLYTKMQAAEHPQKSPQTAKKP